MKKDFIRTFLSVFSTLSVLVSAGAEEPEPDILPLWENVSFELSAPLLPVDEGSLPPEEPEAPASISSGFALMSIPTPAEEIASLADALGNDPVRIFNYVRNHIDYEYYYGLRKGAILTLMEGSGNDFDQSALLVALLNAAGYSDTQYRYRKQRIYYTGNQGRNLVEWMGLSEEPQPGKTFAEVYGAPHPYPPEVSDTTAKQLNWAANFLTKRGSPSVGLWDDYATIFFDRVWVELTITNENGSQTYSLDPSFKRYEKINGLENLLSLAGYDRTAFLQAAGGTVGTDYVQSLSNTNIQNGMTSLAAGVVAQIQQNYPNATMSEIMRGRRIIKEEIATLSEAFPASNLFHGNGTPWPEIPDSYKSKVRFESGSINHVLPTAELDGRRIALSFDGNNIRLWLDDTQMATTTNPADIFSLKITVTHPGGRISAKYESKTYKKNDLFSYAILYGFSASGKQLQKRYDILNKYLDDGLADDSRQVRAELLNIMGLTWLYQTELATRMIASHNDVLTINHHRFGRMAQEQGFYVDVGLQLSASLEADGESGARKHNVFHLGSLFASALEHGIIEQMQPGSSAVSTVNIIRKASTEGQRIYLANSFNWTGTVRGQLDVNYSGLLPTLDTEITNGSRLLLPHNANVTQGNWTGTGYVVRNPTRAGMIISGGYSGGYSTSHGTVSSPSISKSSSSNPTYSYSSPTLPTIPIPPPSVFTPAFHGSDPVDMATGAFVFANTDLETGIAPAPEGLDFSRQYSTLSADKDSQNLGYGWTHALHLRAVERTANEESLGLGTPQQAAAFIAAYLVGADLYREDGAAKDWTVASLVVGWYLDQLEDNAVSITIGNQNFQFIKQPDGSYTPPAGSTMSLAKVSSMYELTQRLGNVIKFDTEGKASSIVDPDGRPLTYNYNTNDTINYVQDAYGRRLTFTYTTSTPKRILNITDSTDNRFVEFRYDTSGNLDRVTDPEGKYFYYDYALTGDPTGTAD
ncbi:MAG: DUF6531 domain-containing protein, partial [Verrucomicrobiota bacterium]